MALSPHFMHSTLGETEVRRGVSSWLQSAVGVRAQMWAPNRIRAGPKRWQVFKTAKVFRWGRWRLTRKFHDIEFCDVHRRCMEHTSRESLLCARMARRPAKSRRVGSACWTPGRLGAGRTRAVPGGRPGRAPPGSGWPSRPCAAPFRGGPCAVPGRAVRTGRDGNSSPRRWDRPWPCSEGTAAFIRRSLVLGLDCHGGKLNFRSVRGLQRCRLLVKTEDSRPGYLKANPSFLCKLCLWGNPSNSLSVRFPGCKVWISNSVSLTACS